MVLTFTTPRMVTSSQVAQAAPLVFAWVLVASVMAFFAWTYFSNPLPGPYGMCDSRGHAVSCYSVKQAH
jgi:hypothetical protein